MKSDIVLLRALMTAGTPGPWEIERDRNNQPCLYPIDNRDRWIALLPHQGVLEIEQQANADAVLIVAVVNALPALLDALQAAEDQAKKAEEWQARNSHSASEFSAACNRADAAEFALADLRKEVK